MAKTKKMETLDEMKRLENEMHIIKTDLEALHDRGLRKIYMELIMRNKDGKIVGAETSYSLEKELLIVLLKSVVEEKEIRYKELLDELIKLG